MIEITTVGGFSEIGRNMTAVKYNDEAVILDMGIQLENYIRLTEDNDYDYVRKVDLRKADAIPIDKTIKDWRKKVVGIVPSHGHLDHIGAIPYMAMKYNAPLVATPYTASVINAILKDKKMQIPNKIHSVDNGNKMKLSDSITLEFVKVTHSIPDTAIVVLHTPAGKVIYANDYKLDNTPSLGEKPDYDRLRELGDSGEVKCLIIDSLYADTPSKTPSEMIAREMLKDVLLNIDSSGKAVLVSTFSSHISRLKSIIEFATAMGRKPVLLGRSLAKYVYAAQDIDLINISDHAEICSYRSQIKKKLKQIEKEGRDKYLIVATGHQGEPEAVLSRIVDKRLGFKFREGDHVVFSCTVIPSPINVANREALEAKLRASKVRIFRDIHASGHAYREDHRDLINMLKPEHIIPAHAGHEKTIHMVSLAKELGYENNKTVHLMENGKRLQIN